MTYSIVAFDRETGSLGSAVASHSCAVGGSVVYSRLGVGLVNTQHRAHLYYGEMALNEMEKGKSPMEALERVLKKDAGADVRQFLALDVNNRLGVWMGSQCRDEKGHFIQDDFAVAGNMLVTEDIIGEMSRTFEQASEEEFGKRLLLSLHAGECLGGDRRGTRSAAIKVVPPPESKTAVNLDLRVDDHDAPLAELRRVYKIFQDEFG